MSHEAVITTLKSLRLHGMAQALEELAQQGTPLFRGALPLMGTLLKAEVAERKARSIADIPMFSRSVRRPAGRGLLVARLSAMARLLLILKMTMMRKVGHLMVSGGLPTMEGERRYPSTGGYYVSMPARSDAEPEVYPCTCVACCNVVCRGECDCAACCARRSDALHPTAPTYGSF